MLAADRLSYGGFVREGDTLVLTELVTEELPPEFFQTGLLGGPPREPGAFAEVVGRMMERIDARPHRASLVLPDAWLRTAFAEVGELPRGEARDNLLRWKLKRLVPFRVDELRVRAVEVPPLPSQEGSDENRRLLLGFAIESLLASVEASFAQHGVEIGRVTCTGLAALAALEPDSGDAAALGDVGAGRLTGLALTESAGYTLVFQMDGRPVLHRAKGLSEELPADARGSFVRRDLKLTESFLAESFPGRALDRMLLVADDGDRDLWADWVESGLGLRPEILGRQHVTPVQTRREPPSWARLLPLVGAAAEEVA